MARPHAITAVPISPQEDRSHRFVAYTIMMAIRVACVISAVFVPGWWKAVAIAGAVVLPYIAVVIANVSRTPPVDDPEAPGPLEITGREA
jgi:hypothetical protein